MVATRITSKRPQSAKSIRRRNSKVNPIILYVQDIKIILKRKEELNADIDNCIFANADQRQKKKPKLQIRNRCKPNANENFDKTINQNSQVNIHMSNTLGIMNSEIDRNTCKRKK